MRVAAVSALAVAVAGAWFSTRPPSATDILIQAAAATSSAPSGTIIFSGQATTGGMDLTFETSHTFEGSDTDTIWKVHYGIDEETVDESILERFPDLTDEQREQKRAEMQEVTFASQSRIVDGHLYIRGDVNNSDSYAVGAAVLSSDVWTDVGDPNLASSFNFGLSAFDSTDVRQMTNFASEAPPMLIDLMVTADDFERGNDGAYQATLTVQELEELDFMEGTDFTFERAYESNNPNPEAYELQPTEEIPTTVTLADDGTLASVSFDIPGIDGGSEGALTSEIGFDDLGATDLIEVPTNLVEWADANTPRGEAMKADGAWNTLQRELDICDGLGNRDETLECFIAAGEIEAAAAVQDAIDLWDEVPFEDLVPGWTPPEE